MSNQEPRGKSVWRVINEKIIISAFETERKNFSFCCKSWALLLTRAVLSPPSFHPRARISPLLHSIVWQSIAMENGYFWEARRISNITVRCAEWWMSAKCSRAYVPTAVSRASLFYGATSFVFVSLLVVILTLRSDVCCVLRRRQEMTVFCKGWKKWLKVSRWIMLKQHLKQVWRISRNLEDNL